MSIKDQVVRVLGHCLSDQSVPESLSQTNLLILGVSGGPDSLCLLHLLCEGELYPRELLVVVHLNHGLRPTAEDEAAFVMDFAARCNVRFISKYCDVAAMARSEGLSIEEAGRVARYQFMASVAGEIGAQYVATGHNADDQVETIVMHLLRGSGMAGLRGMQVTSPLPGAPELTLIRPLLQVSRSEIEAYCDDNNLVPVIDESNQDTTYYRNRLRHELIPLLESYNPQFPERLQKMAVIIGDEESFIEDIVDDVWEGMVVNDGLGWLALDRVLWRSTPRSLQRRVIRRAIQTLAPGLYNVGFRTIEQAREVASHAEVGSNSSLPSGVLLEVGYNQLRFSTPEATLPCPNLPQLVEVGEADLPIPGFLDLENGWMIQAQIWDPADIHVALENQDPWQAFVSVEDLHNIKVRTRIPGERFHPLGMPDGSAKVSRVMIDRKIPERMRAYWPIVADQTHLLWLVGHHIDDRVKIDAVCPQVLHLWAIKKFDE